MNTRAAGPDLVVGAGVIGSQVAAMLAELGHRVSLASRRGSGNGGGPAGSVAGAAGSVAGAAGVFDVAADAADVEAMTRLAARAAVIYNCVNPAYHRWTAEWPPIAASLLAAAERSGAVLVTLSNLYGYGPAPQSLGVDAYDQEHPMTEATPLAAADAKGRARARVWEDALAAHHAGRVRIAEVRASDFVGPGATSTLGERIVGRVRQGKRVSVLGRADRQHTWSFTKDVAKMVVAAGTDPRAWGSAWHVPSNEPLSQRQVIQDFARATGVGKVGVGTLSPVLVRGMGIFSPLMRELRETEYQVRDDFVMDSSAAQAIFGLKPTPWEEIDTVTTRS